MKYAFACRFLGGHIVSEEWVQAMEKVFPITGSIYPDNVVFRPSLSVPREVAACYFSARHTPQPSRASPAMPVPPYQPDHPSPSPSNAPSRWF